MPKFFLKLLCGSRNINQQVFIPQPQPEDLSSQIIISDSLRQIGFDEDVINPIYPADGDNTLSTIQLGQGIHLVTGFILPDTTATITSVNTLGQVTATVETYRPNILLEPIQEEVHETDTNSPSLAQNSDSRTTSFSVSPTTYSYSSNGAVDENNEIISPRAQYEGSEESRESPDFLSDSSSTYSGNEADDEREETITHFIDHIPQTFENYFLAPNPDLLEDAQTVSTEHADELEAQVNPIITAIMATQTQLGAASGEVGDDIVEEIAYTPLLAAANQAAHNLPIPHQPLMIENRDHYYMGGNLIQNIIIALTTISALTAILYYYYFHEQSFSDADELRTDDDNIFL